MTTRYRTILLFGAPGSGKGTAGKALGAIPGFFHCACGDVFRTLDLSSPLGRVFSAIKQNETRAAFVGYSVWLYK